MLTYMDIFQNLNMTGEDLYHYLVFSHTPWTFRITNKNKVGYGFSLSSITINQEHRKPSYQHSRKPEINKSNANMEQEVESVVDISSKTYSENWERKRKKAQIISMWCMPTSIHEVCIKSSSFHTSMQSLKF